MESKVTRTRQSNFELLRLVAMIFVVAIHTDFFSLGWPSFASFEEGPLNEYMKMFFESLFIICVDVFVLISGWFGIKPKFKSITAFIFQCLFFSVGISLIGSLLGKGFVLSQLIKSTLFADYWFIPTYIGLYVLSPVLNSFFESQTKKVIKKTLFYFFIFQTIYGFIFNLGGINLGYSIFSFIGLYFLGRYIRVYQPAFSRFDKKYDLLIYVALCTASSILALILIKYKFSEGDYFFRYTSPLIILAATFFLLAFSKINIQSKVINHLAASSFAIYLFHQHPLIIPIFKGHAQYIYSSFNGLGYLFRITIFIIVISIVSILLDKLRIFIWDFLITRLINTYYKK